ncbi:TIGR01621 family pseudouridine synthase [Gilvimarinus sp. SDUM040013]|uniref:TIGR01621 family pseudouridine synthase n=1 Tax=Gilvimarinus gilvus TaxID=3058038 RepID=A0ABU4RWL7_9GAMM|nr:TIGR01621 family pseudouridine synthase [Gilvimarinus sp. SDUM040013]MDO3386473.1 TIGR01621 family pseudouridine synthase [Gilvimarinus sp. SDUM040013]MDX6849049.1 TIGR01621 family pseudouridine synthase [Gilvimarinus sp. SDUM040013]
MFDVIWQNESVLVVHKHAGIDFHTDNAVPGLFQSVKANLGLDELYPVHRLDKVTSGLLVMAKTQMANRELCRQFAQGEVEKVYLALSRKKPLKKQGRIVGDMAPARRGAWKLLRSTDNAARTAYLSRSLAPGIRLQCVKPKTGKTHQIRVAMKSIGAPIIGDTLYGAEPADRVYLHAYQLAFELAGESHFFRCLPQSGQLFLGEACLRVLEEIGEAGNLLWPSC